MIEIKKVKNLIKNPLLIIPFLCRLGYLNWIKDKTYLKLFAYSRFRKKIKFNNPKTFNDKLQWLKIYDRKTIYTDLVDKKKAKKIVGDLLGESYLIKTIKVFNRPEEIDLEDRKSTRLNSSHVSISYAVFCLKKKRTST